MNDEYVDRLIHGHLDDVLTAEEHAEFQSLMRQSGPARRRFWELAEVHGLMRDAAHIAWGDAEVPEAETRPDQKQPAPPGVLPLCLPVSGLLLNSLPGSGVALTFGMVLGILITAGGWAMVASHTKPPVEIFADRFDSGPPPLVTGVPVVSGVWSGDYAEIVAEMEGVTPLHGDRMLRFLRADYEGKQGPGGYMSDVYRVVDLRAHEAALADDDAVITVAAAFRSLPFPEPNRFQCGVTIYALNALPDESDPEELHEFVLRHWNAILAAGASLEELAEVSVAAAQRRLTLAPSGDEWQTVRVGMQVPPDSRFLMIRLHVSDLAAGHAGHESAAVEFAGHFADDVRVALIRRASAR